MIIVTNKKAARKLILASSSPRRQELIRSLQLPVTVRVSDVDETVPEDWEPIRIVEELSLRKANAVAVAAGEDGGVDSGEGAVVIGSDTIVVLDGAVLGKPKDDQDAVRMLSAMQGREHLVYSGVACVDLSAKNRHAAGASEAIEAIRAAWASSLPSSDDHAGHLHTPKLLGNTGRYVVLSVSASGNPDIIVGHTVSKVTFRPMSDDEIRAYVHTGEPLDKAGAYGVQGLGSVFVERIEGDFYSVMGLPLNLLYLMLLESGVSPLISADK